METFLDKSSSVFEETGKENAILVLYLVANHCEEEIHFLKKKLKIKQKHGFILGCLKMFPESTTKNALGFLDHDFLTAYRSSIH